MMLQAGRQRSQKNKGFTFIELVLVVIIILVLVGITTPQFRRPFQRIQLKNTCQTLVQLMRYVQAKAIAERRFLRVDFDFEQGTFWATRESAHPGEFAGLKGRWGKTFRAPEGISIERISTNGKVAEETSFITFYPDGTSDKAKIKVSDNRGAAFTITTQRRIGYVKVEE